MFKTKHGRPYYLFYHSLRFILKGIFNLLYRVEKTGLDKIPITGKVILCSNHMSYLDPVLIGPYLPRYVYFMAKKELFGNKILAGLIAFLNAFPVDRNSLDRRTFTTSLEVLKDENLLGVFPEGTRSTDGVVREGKRGIGLVCFLSKAPILPIAISGTNKIIQKPRKRIFFPKIRIIVGDLIDVNDIISKNSKKDAIDIIVKKTMDSINELFKKIK